VKVWKIKRVNFSGVPTAPTGFTSKKFNSTLNSTYANSTIKTELNRTYYNTLSDDAKEMTDDEAEWDVGAAAYDATAAQAYVNEKRSKWKGATSSCPGIGLMTTYEFMYATDETESCFEKTGYVYNGSCGTAAHNWMKPGSDSWTISGLNNGNKRSLYIRSIGSVDFHFVDIQYAIVPVVFLKSSVKITSGDGKSPGTAYVLEYDST